MFNTASSRQSVTAWFAAACLCLIITTASGCLSSSTPTPTDGSSSVAGASAIVDGNVNPDPTLIDNKHVSGEPDDTYAEAIDVLLKSSGIGNIQGTISPASDIDIYNLGPMSPGDRIRVDLQGAGLDADIAVYDANARLFIQNDDRAPTDVNPFVNEIVRHDGGDYYLAIAASPFAAATATTGTYTANIVIGRGEPVPPPLAQAVLLNFTGGTITIPGFATFTTGPFDAANIAPAYAGQTAAVKQAIIQTVENDYQGIALQVYATDTNPAPAGTAVSTVFFGPRNPTLLGISQEVDPYNHNPTDSSIIFTDDFGPAIFGFLMTPEELGHAIGNVTSHEIGHLVGLNHVDNPTDVMETAGVLPTLLGTVSFQNSPLDPTIFPMGTQDEPLLLAEILGPG